MITFIKLINVTKSLTMPCPVRLTLANLRDLISKYYSKTGDQSDLTKAASNHHLLVMGEWGPHLIQCFLGLQQSPPQPTRVTDRLTNARIIDHNSQHLEQHITYAHNIEMSLCSDMDTNLVIIGNNAASVVLPHSVEHLTSQTQILLSTADKHSLFVT